MPAIQPVGRHHYAVATKEVAHGAPVVEDGIPGIAIKKKARAWSHGLAGQATIDVGEEFGIEYRGVPYVSHTAAISGAAKGDMLYIKESDNTLTLVSSGNVKFAAVRDLSGQRGCPAGKLRVDLDLKSLA